MLWGVMESNHPSRMTPHLQCGPLSLRYNTPFCVALQGIEPCPPGSKPGVRIHNTLGQFCGNIRNRTFPSIHPSLLDSTVLQTADRKYSQISLFQRTKKSQSFLRLAFYFHLYFTFKLSTYLYQSYFCK